MILTGVTGFCIFEGGGGGITNTKNYCRNEGGGSVGGSVGGGEGVTYLLRINN